MTWKENPALLLWVRIQGCVFSPLSRDTGKWHFQKSEGSWGPLQLLWRSGRSEAVMCYMLWSAGTRPAPLPAAGLALAGLPCLHGCRLWKRVWNQIDHESETAAILSRKKHSQKLLWRLALGSWIQITSRIHRGTWIPRQSKEVPGSKLGPKMDVRNHSTNEVLVRLLEYESTACQKIYRNDKSNLLKSYDISRVQKQDKIITVILSQTKDPRSQMHWQNSLLWDCWIWFNNHRNSRFSHVSFKGAEILQSICM